MSIGKIAEFKVESDNWRLYVERLEQFFVVNKITRDLQVPTLITVVGADCYELLVNLCTPDKPINKSFKELTDILGNHLQPKPSVLAERFKFRRRVQKAGESISQYVADLKKMSKTCEFGTWLEESLRDQLVCGLTSETIRQRLFTEVELNFSKAYQLASSMEAAEKDAALVENRPTTAAAASGSGSVTADCQAMAGAWRGKGASDHARFPRRQDRSQRRRSGGGEAPGSTGTRASVPVGRGQSDAHGACGACGSDSHRTTGCRYARYFCRVCNKQGHLARLCPYTTHYNAATTDIARDMEPSSGESDEVIVNINQISIEQCKPILISLSIDDHLVKMECDTRMERMTLV